MKNTDSLLLACLCAFRTGRPVQTDIALSPEEWRQLYQTACVHKVVPILYEILGQSPGFCHGDPALAARWKQSTLLEASNQARRTQRLLSATRLLDEADIPYAVVKGALCRQMYAKPDLRPSGDEDLLIPAGERTRCGELFAGSGLVPAAVQGGDEVDHWMDPQTGLHIELHNRLFSDGWPAGAALNPYLTQALAQAVSVSVEQATVKTLPPTAHFVFLLAHALKHFIAGGFGVRTLCDILTFAERYQAQIHKETVYQKLEQLHGRIFFDQLMAIGQAYLDFHPDALGWVMSAPADDEPLLEDMLAAGIYGQSSMDRRHSGALAMEAVRNGQTAPSLKAALFPPVSQLSGRYPVLRRAPCLLPAVWLHRIGRYGIDVLRNRNSGNTPGEAIALGKQRTEMMVRYAIIPQNQEKN